MYAYKLACPFGRAYHASLTAGSAVVKTVDGLRLGLGHGDQDGSFDFRYSLNDVDLLVICHPQQAKTHSPAAIHKIVGNWPDKTEAEAYVDYRGQVLLLVYPESEEYQDCGGYTRCSGWDYQKGQHK